MATGLRALAHLGHEQRGPPGSSGGARGAAFPQVSQGWGCQIPCMAGMQPGARGIVGRVWLGGGSHGLDGSEAGALRSGGGLGVSKAHPFCWREEASSPLLPTPPKLVARATASASGSPLSESFSSTARSSPVTPQLSPGPPPLSIRPGDSGAPTLPSRAGKS